MARKFHQKAVQLNVSLAKDPKATPGRLLKDVDSFDVMDLRTPGGSPCQLFYRQLPENPPKWTSFFEGSAATVRALRNRSCGAILIVRRPKGIFALSFGQAHHHLDEEAFEERFGLLITLNSANPDQLRKVDSISLGSRGRQVSVQVGRLGTFGDFGLNVDSDLVRKVAAVPIDASLGKQLVGRQTVTLSVPATLATIDELLDKLHDRFTDKTYQKHHHWLDNVFEVRERSVIDKLDARMLSAFKDERTTEKLWAAVPEVVEWEHIHHFTLGTASDAPAHPDLHVRYMRAAFVRKALADVTVADLKSKTVYAMAPDANYPSYHWSFYRCLYCEVVSDDQLFVLTNGSWFRVAPDFVAAVQGDLAALTGGVPTFNLPDYNDAKEAVYNARVAETLSGFACMDAKNIVYGGARSKIELCDLISDKKVLVFVKRYGGSDVLSHLFQQGTITANLLAIDGSFRSKVNEKLPDSHKLQETGGRFDPQEYTIVYAITTRKDQPILESLPFFSRLSLRNAATLLRGFGYAVQVVGIKDIRPDPEDAEEDG